MKSIKAIIIAVFIWIVGVSFFTLSFYLPILENVEFQANLTLAITIIPNVWLGMYLYYHWGSNMHGLKVGAIVLLTLILLDALITVPYLIIPFGGSYWEFFSAGSFWLIAGECLAVIYLYWRLNIKPQLS